MNILPDKGSRQLNKILEKLAVITDDGELSIDSIFEKQKSSFNRGSTVILITPADPNDIKSSIHIAKFKRIRLIPIKINVDSFKKKHKEINLKVQLIKQNDFIEINYADNIGEKITRSRII